MFESTIKLIILTIHQNSPLFDAWAGQTFNENHDVWWFDKHATGLVAMFGRWVPICDV